MKRHGYLFEKIIDKDNLRKAHKNARRGKRKYKEVQIVDADIEHYIDKLHNMLINGEFTTSEYEIFIKNDKGKSREIYKLPYFPDRIVQHALMQIVEPIWKGMLIKQTYQSIKGRGVHKALNDLRKGLTKDDLWVVKVDIKKYYPSIDNDILYSMLVKKIKCIRTKQLVHNIVYSIKGVPIGNYTSQYFGNVYLNDFDRIVQRDSIVYSRYCDDVVCLVSTKNQGHGVLRTIICTCKSLNVLIKQCKQVWSIVHRPIDYLGYKVHAKHVLVRRKIRTGYKSAMVKQNKDKINGYYGWLLHANCYNLIRKAYEGNNK